MKIKHLWKTSDGSMGRTNMARKEFESTLRDGIKCTGWKKVESK